MSDILNSAVYELVEAWAYDSDTNLVPLLDAARLADSKRYFKAFDDGIERRRREGAARLLKTIASRAG